MELILFGILSVTAIASGIGVITLRQPVHCALSFLLTLASLAGLYLLLNAPFVAVIQIIIYAGAIMVLFVFVMMLLHAQRGESQTNYLRLQGPAGLILSAVFLGLLASLTMAAMSTGATAQPTATKICEGTDLRNISQMGNCLFNQFIFPFEVASVLLLAALIGAVVLTKKSE